MADKKELWIAVDFDGTTRQIRKHIKPLAGRFIAVDFDGTLVLPSFPNITGANPYSVEVVKRFRRDGGKIILHTCRQDKPLQDAIDWMCNNGIAPDYINDNPENRKKYNSAQEDCKKVFADLYIDDHNVFIKRTKQNAVDFKWINKNYNKIIQQILNTHC